MVTLRFPPTVLRCASECPCTSADGLATRKSSAGSANVLPSSNVTASARRSFTRRISTGHAGAPTALTANFRSEPSRRGSDRTCQVVAGVADPRAAGGEGDRTRPLHGVEQHRHRDGGDHCEKQSRNKTFHDASPIRPAWRGERPPATARDPAALRPKSSGAPWPSSGPPRRYPWHRTHLPCR